MDVVCADCGIDVPFEDQYGVPCDDPESGGTKCVCPSCAQKYGFNLDGKNTKYTGWGDDIRPISS